MRCVEVKHRHEILWAKVGIFGKTAAGQQHIGCADGCGVEKCHAFVIVMIPLQVRTVNDAEEVLLMGKKIFCDFHRGNLFQLVNEISGVLNVVLLLHSGRNHLLMLRAVFPEIGAAGAFRGAGIRYIEYIFELRSVPGVVDKGDTFCAPANVAPHAVIPQIIFCAGGGFRALGVDHKLFVIGVLV